jgi:hypothetical protein
MYDMLGLPAQARRFPMLAVSKIAVAQALPGYTHTKKGATGNAGRAPIRDTWQEA